MPRRKSHPTFTRIRKSWHGGLRSLPGLDGKRVRPDHDFSTIEIPVGLNTQFDLTPDDINELAKVLADEALAKRIRALQDDKYPYGTAPEMVCLDYLQRHNAIYVYQAAIAGGHHAGGLVPDFAVQNPGGWRVLAIQGIYWHNLPGKRTKDMSDKLRMIGSYYQGQVVMDVVFLWENHLMAPNPGREQVLDDAMMGVERQE